MLFSSNIVPASESVCDILLDFNDSVIIDTARFLVFLKFAFDHVKWLWPLYQILKQNELINSKMKFLCYK